jgi:putative sigma-54 modulation protein
MRIKIKATNLELTPAIKDYIETKMSMLDKYLGEVKVMNCDVEVSLTTHHHLKGEIYRTEVNLELPGELLRVEKTEKQLFKSIDKVKDHLAPMIVKYKEKKRG